MKRIVVAVLAAAMLAASAGLVSAADIITEWGSVKAPPAPELKPVTVDPKTTVLMMMDFLKPNCGVRPRCLDTLPAMKKLLNAARAAKATVIYTYVGKNTAADIVDPDLKPDESEPSVTSFADKFINTDLEKILKDKGIATVIVVGTLANGAVLYVGSGAALRGYNVIVPVDGMSGVDPYTEQFTAWQLANGPTFGQKVTLTKSDMIKF